MIVSRAPNVSRPERGTHLGDPVAVPVVEHPRLVVGRERACGRDGGGQHLDRLVVRRYQHRHVHPGGRRGDRLGRETVDVPQRQGFDHQADHRQRLEADQQPGDAEVPSADRQRVGDPPGQIGEQRADRGDAPDVRHAAGSRRFDSGRVELSGPRGHCCLHDDGPVVSRSREGCRQRSGCGPSASPCRGTGRRDGRHRQRSRPGPSRSLR
jgi:hypothetical protein